MHWNDKWQSRTHFSSLVEDEENIEPNSQEQNDGETVIPAVERILIQENGMLDKEEDTEPDDSRHKW